jgi:hypothetical protein
VIDDDDGRKSSWWKRSIGNELDTVMMPPNSHKFFPKCFVAPVWAGERFTTAIHEAAHAVIARQFLREIDYVVIDECDGGRCVTVKPCADHYEHEVIICLAGHTAVRMAGLDGAGGLEADVDRALQYLLKLLPRTHSLEQYRSALYRLWYGTYQLLSELWNQVMILATNLVQIGTLTGPEIDELLGVVAR